MGQRAYRQKWSDFLADFLGSTAPAADLVTSNIYSTRTQLSAPRVQIMCGYKNNDLATFDPGVLSAQAYVRILT